MQRRPAVIAHAGASGSAPENTMRAFDLAWRDGADMIELDVWATADGTLIVFHDHTTERWNGRPDVISATDWHQLRRVRIDGEPIPTLEEVCAWARDAGMSLNVEIKAAGFEAAVADMLRRHALTEQVIVSSFRPPVLATLRAIAPAIKRGVLMGRESFRHRIAVRQRWPLRVLRQGAAAAWHPSGDIPALHRLVPLVQRRGVAVNIWTINETEHLERCIALGVDGIITNYPARLRALLDRR
jgi:glycerophosphoryl diester phosphodiesterase